MTDLVPRPEDLEPSVEVMRGPEVAAWVRELRVVWAAVGLSINRFSHLYPVDKGTLSRYLNGKRIPRDHWFLDRLLALQAEQGKAVCPEVREHLVQLQLQALRVAHPHEYRVRVVSDQLELAVITQREAERYARSLESDLADRARQIDDLTTSCRRLRAALEDDRAAIQQELISLHNRILELTGNLSHARRRAAASEERCQRLEERLDQMKIQGKEGVCEGHSEWSPSATGREESAALIRTYELQFVHRLLQCEDYARSVIYSGNHQTSPYRVSRSVFEERVERRMAEQKRLTGPDAPKLWAVLDEAALRRPVGEPEVMSKQFEHLLAMAELPNVTIQVRPVAITGGIEGSSFTFLRFSEVELPDMVFMENLHARYYVSGRRSVEAFKAAMDRLCFESTTPEESVDFLEALIREL
ncbi:DUF5753 domain-containing protein [Actinomadura macra]|uniref:DUF5753 domain-containing protein n=1 Tax=Actinomadura macra TaxID=46164 RepID=UPI0012FC18D5|nr:DUF5753 domain-containing protein [Actinomadura macra]